MSNIQKLFSEKIEIFSAVEFSKVSVLTGIIKISLKVLKCYILLHISQVFLSDIHRSRTQLITLKKSFILTLQLNSVLFANHI